VAVADDVLPDRLRDAAYTVVGLGVLGVQRLQVRRRDLTRALRPQLRDAATRLQTLATTADAKVNPVLDRFEEGLPDATRELVRSAREAATQARDTVLDRAARR
jgi:ABC-type transporter Mla subunit MlaD